MATAHEDGESGESPAPSDTHGIITTGQVFFGRDSRARHMDKKFVIADRDKTRPEDVVQLLSQTWGLQEPRAIISVTGGAQDFLHAASSAAGVVGISSELASDAGPSLEKFVLENLQHGLAAAARATSAWLFTGGMDSGIMSAAGKALAASGTPCIGVAVLRKVSHHDVFTRSGWGANGSTAAAAASAASGGAAGGGGSTGSASIPPRMCGSSVSGGSSSSIQQGERRVHYVKHSANSDRSAGLDANHSHFVLVDGCGRWGDEIQLRAQLEMRLCLECALSPIQSPIQWPSIHAHACMPTANAHCCL